MDMDLMTVYLNGRTFDKKQWNNYVLFVHEHQLTPEIYDDVLVIGSHHKDIRTLGSLFQQLGSALDGTTDDVHRFFTTIRICKTFPTLRRLVEPLTEQVYVSLILTRRPNLLDGDRVAEYLGDGKPAQVFGVTTEVLSKGTIPLYSFCLFKRVLTDDESRSIHANMTASFPYYGVHPDVFLQVIRELIGRQHVLKRREAI